MTTPQDLHAAIDTAMQRAFNLGQTYWQQADSEYASQHRKSDETRRKFEQVKAEVLTAAELVSASTPESRCEYPACNCFSVQGPQACRFPASTPQAAELPPLPAPTPHSFQGRFASGSIDAFTPTQMRDYARAALLAAQRPAGQPEAVPAQAVVEPHLNLCSTCGGSGYVGNDADDCPDCQDTAGVAVPAPTPAAVYCPRGHNWHDFGQLGGRNVSWCPRCDSLAFTGNEPDGVSASDKVQLPEKAHAGIEVLHRVVESLLTTSRYVDEEGEATFALADLLACIADPPFALGAAGVKASDKASISDEELTRRFTRSIGGPNPMYRCNGCGYEEYGVRNLLVDHALACGVKATDPVGINGLTEAETNATASVFGLRFGGCPQCGRAACVAGQCARGGAVALTRGVGASVKEQGNG